MTPRLLLASFDVPGWGGASTIAYALFESLQSAGWDVDYVNLLKRSEETSLRGVFGHAFGNPRSLARVHTQVLNEPVDQTHPSLSQLVSTTAPDVAIGFGFAATNALRDAAADLRVVFATTGAHRVAHAITAGLVDDFMAFEAKTSRGDRLPPHPIDRERQAAAASDRIIVHSPNVRFVFDHYLPEYRHKLHPTTISIADLVYAEVEKMAAPKRVFSERDIDLLFVASHWRRPVKNYPLLRAIASRCAGRSIHVVGNYDDTCPGVTHHGVVSSRYEMFSLFGRAKTVVCPSLVDAAPGVLFEGSAMGCNVVASRNCGNWRLCNEDLVAERCHVTDFVRCIELSLTRPFADRREQFLDSSFSFVAAVEESAASLRSR